MRLQVALLGSSYSSEEQNMGEALVHPQQLQSDHLGEPYMLVYRPVVRQISPSQGGSLGGILLTIDGDGFSIGTCNMIYMGLPCFACLGSGSAKVEGNLDSQLLTPRQPLRRIQPPNARGLLLLLLIRLLSM